jgi:quercetin dioxygenase-like cupin family protein
MNDKIDTQAVNLNDAIDYQEKSVVSQTILKTSGGTLTLFAFDKGQGLSEHTAPFDAMVQIVDGQAEIVIGGSSHIVSAGEFIIMPANIPHALTAIERFKMLLTMIRSEN